MAEFKPMVKMFTDEPSVILKLKKGGKVKAAGQQEGFKSMSQTSGGNPFAAAEKGKSPKKPSMAERRKAMNPNLYAKGGKVAHKQMGGMMPGAAPAMGAGALGGMAPSGTGAAMTPMSRASLAGMAPAARMRRAAQVRRALTGMKKGGSAAAECAKLERELKHHEAMSAKRAHGKASGGEIDAAETRTTLKNSVKPYAKTKMDTAKRDKAHGTGEVKEGKPGGYAMGGSIMGNEGPYENTKMVSAGKGKTNGSTGGVRMGNAGGFKKGGMAACYADGGTIDKKLTRTTVEGGNWENRPANTSKPGVKNTKTGEVKEANAGGYKHGGKASKKHYATGGDIDMGQADRSLRQPSRGDEKRTYNVVNKSGKVVSTHGSQSDAMRSAMKDFDNLSVKRKYASGGNVVDDGKAEKMPRHFKSQPVANSLQSGTFKRGGMVEKEEKPNLRLVKTHRGPEGHTAKVYKDRDWDEYRVKFYSPKGEYHPNADFHSDDAEDAHDTAMGQVRRGFKKGGAAKKYADGGAIPSEIEDRRKTEENERAYRNWERSQREENMADRDLTSNVMQRMADKVKGLFMSPKPPSGSVTKTEKSVTVTPAKKRGGRAC